jgi:hypothetical protein
MALAMVDKKDFYSVYIICEHESNFPHNIPSDLQGFFVSEYVVNRNSMITFKDNNSLRMSIDSDVKDFFNQFLPFNPIDEV